MALGGAFVGVADDATAAEANPAGLCNLATGQVFLEYRYTEQADPVTTESSTGDLTVNPVTGARNLPYLSLTAQSEADNTGTPDFLGFVWPMTLGAKEHRLALSGARQVVQSDDRTLSQTETRFAFDTFPNTVSDPGGAVVAYSVTTPVTGRLQSDIVYWSASAAFQPHEDFSIGLTVSYATLDVKANSSTQVIDPLQLFVDPTHPRLPSQPSADIYQSGIDGTDSAFAYSIGVQWQPVSPFEGGGAPWRFGAVYKKGVQFGVTETTLLNGLPDRSLQNDFVVPDRYSLGASYTLGKRWLFALELERIEYSDQLKGFVGGVNFFTSGRVADGAYTVDPAQSVKFDVDDGILVRAGAEYLVDLGKPGRDLAVRAGYYHSPDNRIRMTQFNSTDPKINAMYVNAFPGGESADHLTAGLGYTMGSSSFHLAIDASSHDGTQVVASYTLSVGTKQKK
jgi:long-subunit fatty acid transport protein